MVSNTRTFTPRIAYIGLVSGFVLFFGLLLMLMVSSQQAQAQSSQHYTAREVVDAGHRFFGSTSGALASAVERTFARYGLPNGYILGEEASGAFIGGLRYGEGLIYTKNAGDHPVYWQGPSVGWDYGIDGDRTMMLVYDLQSIDDLYRRYFGISGSAFLIGGVGVTVLKRGGVLLVPIKTGLGARLGVNVGYLKLRRRPTLNPF